ncbi:P-loop containing nucleoside triphosphate hydrolase protein, partial [Mycena galericulata]
GGGGGGGGYGEDRMSNLGGTIVLASAKIKKNFYIEDKAVKDRSDKDIEEFRQVKGMKVQGRGVPRPVTTFEEAGFPQYLMTSLRAQGFESPTPIQCQAWPMGLSGRDIVAIAQTGSGKTIAFTLPAMLHINASVLFLMLRFFHSNSRIRNTAIHGGAPKGPQ